MIAISLDQRDQKRFGSSADFGVIETQSGKATGGAAATDAAVEHAAIAPAKPGLRVFVEHPFGRGGDEFRKHDLDAVLRGEVHHAVVVAPVVLARRDLDGAPHDPMAKGVHADARGSLVITRPILLGGIGFAEVDCSVGEGGRTGCPQGGSGEECGEE